MQTSKAETEKERTANPAEKSAVFPVTCIILIAAWFGLLTGVFEILIGLRLYRKDPILNLSWEVLWMAPFTELAIFLLLGCILALLASFIPRVFTIRVVCFLLAALSFFALFLLIDELHVIAKWALAIGLSVQAARIIGKYQDGFYRFAKVTSAFLIAAVVGFALFTSIWVYSVERSALANLPAASEKSPNVLLITLDTVRAKSLSVYGYERETTPNLERFAKESTVFDNAIATSSWTLPSHASIMTGKYPSELKVAWFRRLGLTNNTLADELGQRGYESAGFVANYLFCSKPTGLNRGMVHYEDYEVSSGQFVLSSSLGQWISNSGWIRRAVGYHENLNVKTAADLNEDFLGWVADRDPNRPFFAFLNYFDAHEPLLPPAPFDGRFGPTRPEGKYLYQTIGVDFMDKHEWSKQDADKHRNAYDSSIAYLDDQLGLLFRKLAEKGILDNTVVIITSDHGESFGEHGFYGHGTTLYFENIHVPLIIRFPGKVPKSLRSRDFVSVRDIPATVMDLIGVENKKIFPGSSLERYFREPSAPQNSLQQTKVFSELEEAGWIQPWYPASKGDIRSVLKGKYQYIWGEDGKEELYDLESDPNELKDLSHNADMKKALADFRSEQITVD